MFQKIILLFFLFNSIYANEYFKVAQKHHKKVDVKMNKVEKTEEEWRKILNPEQYRILREDGTERAFTGILDKHYESGVYHCAACGQPLFSSIAKYDSKTGWPSFWAPVAENIILFEDDYKFFMRRVEVSCKRCGGHLGHVFDDGPAPTGLRYCLNSASLKFIGDDGKEVEG